MSDLGYSRWRDGISSIVERKNGRGVCSYSLPSEEVLQHWFRDLQYTIWEASRRIFAGDVPTADVFLEGVCDCPRCNIGRLTVSNRRDLLQGTAILWMNCGHCGLFRQVESKE